MVRIGVISDTHCEQPTGSDLPWAVLQAVEGVDLIVHCGDLMTIGVLDQLGKIAPVVAVRSRADPEADGERLHEPPHCIEIAGLRIGVLSRYRDLPALADLGDEVADFARLRDRLPTLFGGDVDVMLHRGAHRDRLQSCRGTLFVDPGSPTSWAGRRASVVVLHVEDGAIDVSIRDITRNLPADMRYRLYWARARHRGYDLLDGWRAWTRRLHGART